MFTLFRKEIKTFLGSLIGYLAVLVFLLVTGLFLWVFPGAYNIPDNGYATLEGLFSLAPWLYLFLVPAITMRFFADEKRSGTLELLMSRPISDFKIILAKFFAALVLVIFSLLPTLLYFLSVYLLGNPVGSIDTGATWGSFTGLFFLAAVYIAIGLFASALTENQIVAFILAMALSFVFYLGFDFIGGSGVPYLVEQLFSWLSINNHYLSISRGVIDFRDLIYFLGIPFIFLWLTMGFLRNEKKKSRSYRKKTLLIFGILAVVFWGSGNLLYRIDLTSDKRFSISRVSTDIANKLKHPVEIELFLAGRLEPGLLKLQQEIFEKTAILNAYASREIRIKVTDPYSAGSGEEQKKFFEQLKQKGIRPTSFRHKTEQGVSTKLIFPGAIVRYNGRERAVNFLKYNPDFSHEANFNHSIENVEFELVNALQKLRSSRRSTVAFLEGHGEPDRYQVYDFASSLTGDFRVRRIGADSLLTARPQTDILIIADPVEPFPEKDKFSIDQFIMQGGKVLWLIDPVKVDLDSLSAGHMTFAFPRNLNLSDQLFRYGVRLNKELLQDVDCARIRVNTAPPGNEPQFTLHPWYYSPLLVPSDNHPLSKNLNRVLTEFVSSVDTLPGNPEINKEVILSTSPYARRVESPSTVSLKNIDNPPDRQLFNESFIPAGVLLEGTFTSVFKNRMTEPLGIQPSKFITESRPTKMVIIADGGLITNEVNRSTNPPQIRELGFDRVSGRTFGNKAFLMNAVYYLDDEQGIMHLRNRNQKLRLLDKVRLRHEKARWQWLNVLLPLVVVALFGVIYNASRRARYSRKKINVSPIGKCN